MLEFSIMEPAQNQNWFARKETLKSFQYLYYITNSFIVQFPNVNNWASHCCDQSDLL